MEGIITKKEFDHSYLLIPMVEETREEYSYRMITQNKIPGLLCCRIRYIEEESFYSYEISMKRSLLQEYSDKKMKYQDLKELFINMNTILKQVSEFLLEKEGFLLEPEYMYMDWESNSLECVYLPVAEPMDQKDNQYRKLADFLLDRTDHKDEHAVNAAYQFYKMSKEEFFSFEAFIGFLEKEDLMIEAHDRRREERKIQSKEVIEENSVYIEEKDLTKKSNLQAQNWKIPITLLIVGCVLAGSYLFIPIFKSYALYLLIPGLSLISAAVIFFISFIWINFKESKKDPEMELEIPVTVEEYFDDILDNETVFFDEERTLCLKWKEGHFSKEYMMTSFPITVGKLKESVQLCLEDASISRLHARFIQQESFVILQDLDSTNGTWVNGKKLSGGEEIIIRRNDEIQFGKIIVNVV